MIRSANLMGNLIVLAGRLLNSAVERVAEVLVEPSEGEAASPDVPFVRTVVPAVPAPPAKPRPDDTALSGVTRADAVRGGREEAWSFVEADGVEADGVETDDVGANPVRAVERVCVEAGRDCVEAGRGRLEATPPLRGGQ